MESPPSPPLLAEQPAEHEPSSSPGLADGTAAASPARVSAPSPWLQHLKRILPVLSLAVGVAGALMMTRTPERAPLVAGAALLVWLVMSIRSAVVLRRDDRQQQIPGSPLQLSRVVHFSALFATQSLIQLCIFFTLPFYWDATTPDPGHVLFMGVLGVLAVSSLWDPFTEWLLDRPGVALVFPTVASFLALSAVLPGLSFDNRRALWTAAGCSAAGAFLSTLLTPFARGFLQRLKRATIAGLVPVVFLAVGGARLVPAAPMRMVSAAFGTERSGHWVARELESLTRVPGQLICATALYAPLGVHETLYHVWEHDGQEHQRIALSIIGGRKAGYRTRSLARYLGPSPRGRWTCRVMTAGGQLLGSTRLQIK